MRQIFISDYGNDDRDGSSEANAIYTYSRYYGLSRMDAVELVLCGDAEKLIERLSTEIAEHQRR